MESEWRVSHNYAGGEKMIQVYRIRHTNEPDHAGNREYVHQIFTTDEEAHTYADKLNAGR